MGRAGGGCAMCSRPSRRGHGRVVVGHCACGAALCDYHGRWLDGEIICPRCLKYLPPDDQKRAMRPLR